MPREPQEAREDSESNAEDLALMAAIGRGDAAALRRLVEKHQHAVLGTIAKMTGRIDDAEDLAQQVFVRVWKSAPRYQPTAKFTTWLFTIVRNLVFNEARRAYRKQEVSMDAHAEATHSEEPDRAGLTPEQILLHRELSDAADAAIAALPEPQRMAVLLRRFENMPYEDIADILDTTVPAVKSLLFRARGTLRESLGRYLGEN